MKFLILIFLLLMTSKTFAKGFYFGPGIAKARYMNDRIKSYGTHSSGYDYSFHGGYRFGPMSVESFVRRLYTVTEPMQFRGDQRYKLYARNITYGAQAKYYIHLFNLRFGYAFHHFNLTLKPDTSGPEIEDPILASEFGVDEKSKQSGTLFGVGLDFPIGMIAPYFAATSFQVSNSNTSYIEFEFGLNIKI